MRAFNWLQVRACCQRQQIFSPAQDGIAKLPGKERSEAARETKASDDAGQPHTRARWRIKDAILKGGKQRAEWCWAEINESGQDTETKRGINTVVCSNGQATE